MSEFVIHSGSHLRGLRTGWGGESRLQPRLVRPDCTMRYVQRVRPGQMNNEFIYEFVVLRPQGTLLEVFGVDDTEPDGTAHAWEKRWHGADELVFTPHPAYRGGPVVFVHDKDVVAEPMVEQSTTTYSFPTPTLIGA